MSPRPLHPSTVRRVGILAALVVPLLSACGGGSSSGPATPPPPPPPPPAPTQVLSLLAGNTDGSGNQDGAALTQARFSPTLGAMAMNGAGEAVIT